MVINKDIKSQLIADWMQIVSMGWIPEDKLRKSLYDQINGVYDMSLDEYDVAYAQIMGDGWDEKLTDEQCDIWRDIVNNAAREYLAM